MNFLNKTLLSLGAIFIVSTNLFAAEVTANSTATWDVTVRKDTRSELVVTALNNLNFTYAPGLKSFNSQKGAFDVSVQGQDQATDFKLEAKVIQDTLGRSGNIDPSTLTVGVKHNGQLLQKNQMLTLIDLNKGIGGEYSGLASENVLNNGQVSGQGKFDFDIISATDGTKDVDYDSLGDGNWTGNVVVQFVATWAK